MTTWWERLVYQLALAFWRAYFEMLLASKAAREEMPNATDLARRDSFRAAVKRMLAEDPPRPVDPTPSGQGREGDNLGEGPGRKSDKAGGQDSGGVVGGQSYGG